MNRQTNRSKVQNLPENFNQTKFQRNRATTKTKTLELRKKEEVIGGKIEDKKENLGEEGI